MSDHKVGRNEPCPCGSGMKYKKCCLGSELLLTQGNLFDDAHMRLKSSIEKKLGRKIPATSSPEDEQCSEAMISLIGDLIEDTDTWRNLRILISITVIAWNVAVMSSPNTYGKEMKTYMKKYVDEINAAPYYDVSKEVITEISSRKKMVYPELDRFIFDFKLSKAGTGFNVALASFPLSHMAEWMDNAMEG